MRQIEPKTKSETKETQNIGIIHRKPHNNHTRNNSTIQHYKGKQRLLIDTRLRGKWKQEGNQTQLNTIKVNERMHRNLSKTGSKRKY